MLKKSSNEARGIRNNNPGNIRENQRVDYDWEGEAKADIDSEFEEFISPEYGIRAMARILRSYAARGLITIDQIVSTWAPEIDNNDTESYIKSVEQRAGINRYEVVNENHWLRIIEAIIHHENGYQPYELSTIRKGIALA